MSLEGWQTLRAIPRVDGGPSTDGAQADRDWTAVAYLSIFRAL